MLRLNYLIAIPVIEKLNSPEITLVKIIINLMNQNEYHSAWHNYNGNATAGIVIRHSYLNVLSKGRWIIKTP